MWPRRTAWYSARRTSRRSRPRWACRRANDVGLGAAQVGEHGEHPPVVLRACGEVELPEDTRHVALDGTLADVELLCDGAVGAPLGHPAEHLALALGEGVERPLVPRPAEHLSHDRGVEHGAA